MASTPQASMKKRQVIANSNRTMFIWVAGMSAVLGICAVLSYFLIQQIVFKGKVVSATASTASTLKNNIKSVEMLEENLRVMETNTALNSVKAEGDEKALRVILDALPADPNTLALGSSIQQRLSSDIPGLVIESLTVLPLGDTEEGSDAAGEVSQLPFTMTVRSENADALKQLLQKFERSIRTIDIDSLTIERSERGYTMTMQAHGYYVPAMSVSLGSMTCTPEKGCKK